MNKGTKITLWSIGGLAVAAGLLFGVRAIIQAIKSNNQPPVLPPLPIPVVPTPVVIEPPSNGGGPKIRGGSFPIRFGDRGEHVEAWQSAIARLNGDDWCSASKCNGGTWRSPINVDGKFGEQTALYTNCHYPSVDCALCPIFGKGSLYPIGSADYSQCSISYSKFKSVVGSAVASEFSNFEGADDNYSNFDIAQTPAQVQLEKRGGCPCDKAHPECCMPDYVDVPTPTGAPYSNVNGVGFNRDIEISDSFYGTTFSGEQTDDEYLNMYKGFN